jgi:hypothetical protein
MRKKTKINKAYGSVSVTDAILIWLHIGGDQHIEEINPTCITISNQSDPVLT